MYVHFPKPFPLSSATRFEYRIDKRQDGTSGRGAYWGRRNGRWVKSRGVVQRESLYFWWFEYLKRSWKYQNACSQSVILTSAMQREYEQWWTSGGKALFNAFGDIFATDFWNWWSKHGAYLFGIRSKDELHTFNTVRDANALKEEIANGEFQLVAIPATLSKRAIQRKLGELLDEMKQQHVDKQAQARYHPHNMSMSVEKLEESLLAYDMKRDGKSNVYIGAFFHGTKADELAMLMEDGRQRGKNYDYRWIEKTANKLSVEAYDEYISEIERSEGEQRTAKKRYLSLKSTRYLNRARANIVAAERGIFPVTSVKEVAKTQEAASA